MRDTEKTPAVLPQIVLASASSARAQVLERAGIPFTVQVSSVDEDAVIAQQTSTPSPAQTAQILAEAKGQAVADNLDVPANGAIVLAADSVFEFQGQALGKPYDPEVAIARWQQQNGQTGILHTGHWIGWLNPTNNDQPKICKAQVVLDSAEVTFATVSDEDIAAYVATGEPLGCAGGFTLEGRGAGLVASVNGDPNTVLGLSLNRVRATLSDWGIALTSYWKEPPLG